VIQTLARYTGRCGLCEETIYEGDPIDRFEDEWCHATCVRDEIATGNYVLEDEE